MTTFWLRSALFALTALLFLATPLAFVPVPWPDSSAFYLPAHDLLQWPPRWLMHAQAAFVPSYDQANFNLMPGLPLLLGGGERIAAALHLDIGPEALNRALSLCALLAWAALLWGWVIVEARASWAAAALALAGLWDPVLRWGTMVVRTETWIGLCWLTCLRQIHFWERTAEPPALWSRTAWKISFALAAAAYFHFEAAYLVPATIVGLGFSRGWFARLVSIALRTTLLLSPWIAYVLLHLGLFVDQMRIQFSRLAHGNPWLTSAHSTFHGMFLELGSPASLPKFFNLGKGAFWLLGFGLAGLTALAAFTPTSKGMRSRRTLLAATTAFASCFYLWATKDEVWFITLCHMTLWSWAAAAAISARHAPGKLLVRRVAAGLAACYATVALAATISQARALSAHYDWPTYRAWVDCIETALGPVASKPRPRLWQPHAPDVLVELSRRHPGWDLTRALDFPARRELALRQGETMDAVLFTRAFNGRELNAYAGAPRAEDYAAMMREEDLPFGPWGLERLRGGGHQGAVCERGPFWAMVVKTGP